MDNVTKQNHLDYCKTLEHELIIRYNQNKSQFESVEEEDEDDVQDVI